MVYSMPLRTVALALALSCGLVSIADGKQKPAAHKVKPRKGRTWKAPNRKTSKLKAHKFKAPKQKIKG